MEHIILTGFEPFGQYPVNPVEKSTKAFDKKIIGGHTVMGIVLRCTYRGAFEELKRVIEATNPVAVVSTGLASRVRGIRFETTGRNLMHGKYPDADKFEPKGQRILENERDSFLAHSDSDRLAQIVNGHGIPTEVSDDAETFVCNALLYLTSHYIEQRRLRMRNVFLHTPWTSEYADKVKPDPEKIVLPQEALYTAIEEVIKNVCNE